MCAVPGAIAAEPTPQANLQARRPSHPLYYEDYQAPPTTPDPAPLPVGRMQPIAESGASDPLPPPGADPLPPAAPTSQTVVPPPPTADTAPASTDSPDPLPPTAPQTVEVPEVPSGPVVPESPIPAPTATPEPGELFVTVTSVQVVGAAPELEALILESIQTKPGSQTSERLLAQDAQALRETGFFTQVAVTTQPNPAGVDVTFTVEPVVVRSLQLANAQVLPLDVANDAFRDQFDQPINPASLQQAVQQINQWYAAQGYTLARVLTVEPRIDGLLVVTVAEGAIGDVRVRFVNQDGQSVDENGNPIRYRTQDSFVRRQIKLQPGDVFQEQVVKEDLERLSKLGIFETATVSLEGDANRVDVIYNIVEAKARRVNFGGGYNDVLGLFGSIGFTDANFGGLGQQFNLSGQIGTRNLQFELDFRSPYRDTEPGMPGYGFSLFRRQGPSRVFDDEIPLANGDDARERRLGLGVNLEYPVGPTWLGRLGLNYSVISMRDEDNDIVRVDRAGNPLSLSGEGIDDLYTISFSATRDQRDNPTNPGRGSLLVLSTIQSLPIGRGNILSNRLQANYAQYVPVDIFKSPEGEKQFPEIFAFNIQAGTVLGDLPPYDAFLLGGIDSVRGYGIDDVATSRSYLQLSAEYRFPIYRFIGGVLFADFATDLGSSDNVLGEPGPQRDKPGSGFGTGVGLRFNTPIGIIRAEFGVNDQGETRLQFGFGQRF